MLAFGLQLMLEMPSVGEEGTTMSLFGFSPPSMVVY
jgi:hypothetical protein